MNKKKSRIEEAAYNLFGEMRESTKEENELIQKYIDSISEPTGINIWDLLDRENQDK